MNISAAQRRARLSRKVTPPPLAGPPQAQAANAAAQTAQAWANVEEQNAALAEAAPGPEYVQAVTNAQAAENQLISAERQQSEAEQHVQEVEAPPAFFPPPWRAPRRAMPLVVCACAARRAPGPARPPDLTGAFLRRAAPPLAGIGPAAAVVPSAAPCH